MIWADIDDSEVRIYLDASELMLADQEMYARIQGEWVQINAVYKDPSGYYVNMKKNPNVDQWWCPDCNFCNYGWSRTCQRLYGNGEKCGYPRPW